VQEGVLRPDYPDEQKRLEDLYAGSFLLVHPTREDTNPLVITEAAYFGCPTVSVEHFAIPELVIHRETGVLVDFPATPEAVGEAIAGLLENRTQYLVMRARARDIGRNNHTWEAVGNRMVSVIKNSI
jgi:glycosyltransferase involved in cell wall biosynthesis